jgi:hypothetical protein
MPNSTQSREKFPTAFSLTVADRLKVTMAAAKPAESRPVLHARTLARLATEIVPVVRHHVPRWRRRSNTAPVKVASSLRRLKRSGQQQRFHGQGPRYTPEPGAIFR